MLSKFHLYFLFDRIFQSTVKRKDNNIAQITIGNCLHAKYTKKIISVTTMNEFKWVKTLYQKTFGMANTKSLYYKD